MTYVREAALVTGASAHLLSRLMARYLPPVLAATPMSDDTRAEIEAMRAAVDRAAAAWEARAVPASVDGHADMDGADIGREWMTTAQAADVLRVTTRQARRLAAEGLGHRAGREWVLDRSAVYAEAQRRRDDRR